MMAGLEPEAKGGAGDNEIADDLANLDLSKPLPRALAKKLRFAAMKGKIPPSFIQKLFAYANR